ncbi:MAG: hypothetical protein OEV51_07100 [Nitrospira sp.]|nr:hypothetical protein [Nitrospira sp.]
MSRPAHHTMRIWPLAAMFVTMIGAKAVWAVPMANDPKGFHDIPWGTVLSSRQDLEAIRASSHIVEYLHKEKLSSFAGAEMRSILYVSLNGQFARVVIRYESEQVHKQVLSHLEGRFGQLDRIPGQMARGLTQQYNWRGTDTEINLTYQASTERGYIFIDSRTLAPRFNDDITDSAE